MKFQIINVTTHKNLGLNYELQILSQNMLPNTLHWELDLSFLQKNFEATNVSR